MKKITRFLFCTFVAIMLMGTAISATACHQKEEYPSVPEVTEPQPTGEIIPTVDRQKELKDARKKYADAVAWLYMPGAEVDDPIVQAKDNAYYLQKDENGNYSEWGCYYAHCDNRLSSRSKLDRNTVIFGHSASNCDPDGPKLTKLHRYDPPLPPEEDRRRPHQIGLPLRPQHGGLPLLHTGTQGAGHRRHL